MRSEVNPREIIEQLIACHEEPSCPAVAVARQWLDAAPSVAPQAKALSELLAYCDLSDDCRCGTLSVSIVRSLLEEAIAAAPTERLTLTDAQIVEIRDGLLPSQGDAFDCLAFARAALAAQQAQTKEPRS